MGAGNHQTSHHSTEWLACTEVHLGRGLRLPDGSGVRCRFLNHAPRRHTLGQLGEVCFVWPVKVNNVLPRYKQTSLKHNGTSLSGHLRRRSYPFFHKEIASERCPFTSTILLTDHVLYIYSDKMVGHVYLHCQIQLQFRFLFPVIILKGFSTHSFPTMFPSNGTQWDRKLNRESESGNVNKSLQRR